MSYPSEYSLKSAQGAPLHHSRSSSGNRFMNLLRSLFRPTPEASSRNYAPIPPRPASISLKNRKTEPPFRPSYQYETLLNNRDLATSNNMALSGTHLSKPSSPVIPYRICNRNQYYSPQIRRSNNSNFYAQSSGIQGIRIVNLDSQPTQLVRTFSYHRPGEKSVIKCDRRPIYSKSVEINISDPVPYRVIQQPSTVINQQSLLPSAVSEPRKKKVISVANIPIETQYIQPQLCISNAREKEITLKREYSDTFSQQTDYSSQEESRRKMEIKERILSDWEHSWRHGDHKLDGSFSSLGTNREEPSMVGSKASLYSFALISRSDFAFSG
ncbi:unnamed protein product [Hymenolepis diminuta]|uniref:Uncharacterized protein n=1 Tax=Hymenolepis diminuta TaxID=6216 RepID=A0A564YTT2_HYMDI|nr:unnamed protein product [Hymenolepis diminuta]